MTPDLQHANNGQGRGGIPLDDIRRVAELASDVSGVNRATIEAVLADEVERRGAGLLTLVALAVVHHDMVKLADAVAGVSSAIDCR